MARRKKLKNQNETLVDIVEVQGQAQDFFEKNQTTILGILFGVVLIVGGFFVYKFMIQEPKEKEAMLNIYQAEYQFRRDSFELALNNPGNDYPGFADLVNEYKGTKAGNLANYYAGICYLHLGKYDAALSYLDAFDADGKITPAVKYGAMGDAKSELSQFDEAIKLYKRAADSERDNNLLSAYYLKKAGMLEMKNGNNAAALTFFNQIKEQYPETTSGSDIDKYIARVSSK